MSEYTVDKNVPIPPYGKEGPPCKYPWYQMEPGDSFFARGEAPLYTLLPAAGHNWCAQYRPDCTVTIRKVKGGVRVWMVKKEAEDD